MNAGISNVPGGDGLPRSDKSSLVLRIKEECVGAASSVNVNTTGRSMQVDVYLDVAGGKAGEFCVEVTERGT